MVEKRKPLFSVVKGLVVQKHFILCFFLSHFCVGLHSISDSNSNGNSKGQRWSVEIQEAKKTKVGLVHTHTHTHTHTHIFKKRGQQYLFYLVSACWVLQLTHLGMCVHVGLLAFVWHKKVHIQEGCQVTEKHSEHWMKKKKKKIYHKYVCMAQ